MTPTGMLMKKIHSQPAYLVSTPPRSTPTAAPEPPMAPQTPSALFRSAPSSNVVVMIESAAGEMIAAPKPWMRAGGDQHALGPGETAEERRGREQHDAGEEHAAAAEDVGCAPSEQQEPAERDRVRGHDPLQVVAREVEVLPDRRQGHVHDRDVEDGHEVRRADHGERLPAARIELGHLCSPSRFRYPAET